MRWDLCLCNDVIICISLSSLLLHIIAFRPPVGHTEILEHSSPVVIYLSAQRSSLVWLLSIQIEYLDRIMILPCILYCGAAKARAKGQQFVRGIIIVLLLLPGGPWTPGDADNISFAQGKPEKWSSVPLYWSSGIDHDRGMQLKCRRDHDKYLQHVGIALERYFLAVQWNKLISVSEKCIAESDRGESKRDSDSVMAKRIRDCYVVMMMLS